MDVEPSDFEYVIRLKDVEADFFKYIVDEYTSDKIVNLILDDYDVSREVVTIDLKIFIDKLKELNVLIE